MESFIEVYKFLKEEIGNSINSNFDIDDDKMYEIIDHYISEYNENIKLSIRDKIKLRLDLFYSYKRLGILEDLLNDKTISEIMINGYKDIFVEQNFCMKKLNIEFDNKEQLEDLIQQIVAKVNRIVNVANPIVDARLEDGSRVHIVLFPVAINGPIITIRKFPEVLSMKKLIEYKAIDEDIAVFLSKLVLSGYNIFISGGTNSGKTTFLNALSSYIPEDERVITIEDSAELNLRHIKNLVSLETKNANSNGEGAISMSELIKAALRMNPDRIVVGEVRGKEALDMLQAMNTGHDGSLSTGHANSPKDMLSRIETMVLSGADLPLLAIRSQIASAIDIIIHLGRLNNKKRKVLSIVEVGEYIEAKVEVNVLYEYEKEEDRLVKKGELRNTAKLKNAGIRL